MLFKHSSIDKRKAVPLNRKVNLAAAHRNVSTGAINILVSYKTKHCNNQCGTISKNELAELMEF